MILQTSALDARTETELMKNIDLVLSDRKRTSIFIAHRSVLSAIFKTTRETHNRPRLRTVVEADLILVFNNGEIVEQGTHQQLLDKGGLYYSMWVEQAYQGVEEDEGDSVDNARLEESTKQQPSGRQR